MEREVAFTPGPWLIEPQGSGARGHWLQRESDGEYIAMSCKLKDRTEEDANANLIAAAPDLYAALSEAKGLADMAVMSDELDGTQSDDQRILTALREKIEAALAKARGESATTGRV